MGEPELTIGRIKLADDDQVLNACEAEVVGWEAAEQAQLATPLDEVSTEAHRLRAIILLMTDKKLDRDSAEERYERLLADSERTIPYLKERIQQLLDDGVIQQYEFDDYYEYERLSDADDFDFENEPIEHRAFDKIIALLSGLNDKESTRWAKLNDEFLGGGEERERLRLKFLGLDDDEIEESIIRAKQKEFPPRLKAREEGFPRELAERMQELFDKVDKTILTPEERQEKNNFIHLRSVCSRAGSNHGVRLALKEFGVEKMLEYITLQTKFDGIESRIENIISTAQDSLHVEEVRAATQSTVDSLESEMKLSPVEEQRNEELRAQLQKEPLLRRFVNNYRDAMFGGMQRMFG
ncbi:hypothetical protein ACFLZH_03010 [Patescibacteria group bacterium]